MSCILTQYAGDYSVMPLPTRNTQYALLVCRTNILDDVKALIQLPSHYLCRFFVEMVKLVRVATQIEPLKKTQIT